MKIKGKQNIITKKKTNLEENKRRGTMMNFYKLHSIYPCKLKMKIVVIIAGINAQYKEQF